MYIERLRCMACGREFSKHGGHLIARSTLTDFARSYQALKDYGHDFVNHRQQEYTYGEVPEKQAEGLSPCSSRTCECMKGVRAGRDDLAGGAIFICGYTVE